jgi:phosphatidylglycerophosphate synthase
LSDDVESSTKRRWSACHASLLLIATLIALAIGKASPVAVTAIVSLGAWLWLSRDAFVDLRGFGAANAVTSARVLLLALLSTAIDAGAAVSCAFTALGIFVLDGLDGWLARRKGRVSSFGAHYDMETDACFVLLLSIGLHQLQRAGLWVLLAGALRYLYVLTLFVLRREHAEAPRSRLGRYLFGLIVLAFTAACWPAQRISQPLAAAATLLLSYSFARSFYWSLRAEHVLSAPR